MKKECRFIPAQCLWCSKKVHNKEVSGSLIKITPNKTLELDHLFPQHHIKQECSHVATVVSCSNGCGEKLAVGNKEV